MTIRIGTLYSPGMFRALNAADAPDLESFVRDTLATDWACFTAESDRVDLPRLRAMINAFPGGFRLYLMKDMPVGYTGWYPIAEDVFSRMYRAPETITNRGQIMPAPCGDYLYISNYSIIPALHKTEHSRRMMKELAESLRVTPHKGLAAVTVSPHGVRVAEKFGMGYRGDMTHDGVTEGIYALRL